VIDNPVTRKGANSHREGVIKIMSFPSFVKRIVTTTIAVLKIVRWVIIFLNNVNNNQERGRQLSREEP
jgi:hypothetical protein